MKIEFKKSANRPDQEYVFVNEILEGKMSFDDDEEAFVYEPTTGPRIVLPLDYDEAHQVLIGKLSQLYR